MAENSYESPEDTGQGQDGKVKNTPASKSKWYDVGVAVLDSKIDDAECVVIQWKTSYSKTSFSEETKPLLQILKRGTSWAMPPLSDKEEDLQLPFNRLWWKDKTPSGTPGHVYDLLVEKWNLKKPLLVVSVIADGDIADDVPSKLQHAFQKDIETLLRTPDTWILIDGTNTPFAQLVGKAVERLGSKRKRSAVVIGVTKWNGWEKFKEQAEKRAADASSSADLNRFISYFILLNDTKKDTNKNGKTNTTSGDTKKDDKKDTKANIKNGKTNTTSGDTKKDDKKDDKKDTKANIKIDKTSAKDRECTTEAKFIAKFQSYISKLGEKDANGPEPKAATVSLVFGGKEDKTKNSLLEIVDKFKNHPSNVVFGGKEDKTKNSLLEIVDKFKNHPPIVVIKGSGGAADIISGLIDPVSHTDEDLTKLADATVCVLDGDSTPGKEIEGLNAAVLRAVIKFNEALTVDDLKILHHQIELSLSLNESQLAKEQIFEGRKDNKKTGRWAMAIQKIIKKNKENPMDQNPMETVKKALVDDQPMKKLKKALANDQSTFVELFLQTKYYCTLREICVGDVDELYITMLETNKDEAIVTLLNKLFDEVRCNRCKDERNKKANLKGQKGGTANSTWDQKAGSKSKNILKHERIHEIGKILAKLVGPHYELRGIYSTAEQSQDCCACSASCACKLKDETPCCPKANSSDHKNNDNTRKVKKKNGKEPKTEMEVDIGTHLFLWAVLFNRVDIAYFFWKNAANSYKQDEELPKMKHPHIIMALMASTILSQLAKEAHDGKEPALHQSLAEHAKLFEDRAIAVLMECSADDRHKTQDILTREHSKTVWGEGTTLMSAAYNGKRRHFLECIPCQVKLDAVWRGRMIWSTPWWKIFLTAVCPIFIFLIKFTDNEVTASIIRRFMGCQCNKTDVKPTDETDTRSKWSSKSKVSTSCKVGCTTSDDPKTVNFISAWLYFYTSPITKFYACTFSYLVFLGLFSYTALTEIKPGLPNIPEIIVWAWILLFCIEEIRQILDSANHTKSGKNFLKIWLDNKWNRFDGILYFALSPLCVLLRMVLVEEHFQHARNAFAITLACFFFRFLQIYYAFKEVGAKVMVIFHMMKDLFKFGLILFVFILSYGVAITIILYPNRPLSLEVMRLVLYSPFWQIFVRDAFVDSIDGEDGVPRCTGNLTQYSTLGGSNQCNEVNGFVDALLVIYTMFTNVLLLNVLIAMFNSTYERFQKESTTWWHFNRYFLVHEYVNRPAFAPPLIILSYIHRLGRLIIGGCQRKKDHSKLHYTFGKNYEEELTDFERINMEKRMERQDRHDEFRKKFQGAGATSIQAERTWDADSVDDENDGMQTVRKTMLLEDTLFNLSNQLADLIKRNKTMDDKLTELQNKGSKRIPKPGK